MLSQDAFVLPLEKELRLQVIRQEVKECSDIEALKENLVTCAESLMKYQHLSAKLAEENLTLAMTDIFTAIGVDVVVADE